MNFVMNYVDELAAEEHRHELEEQARIERMLQESRAQTHPSRWRSSLRAWLHLKGHDQPADDGSRRN
jgi:hypothetical protein